MTLKEKFDSISCKDCDMPYCDIKCTMLSDWELNKLEQIADEFAIEFSEWCTDPKNKLGYHSTKKEWFVWDLDKWVTTKELLEIFKKEKEL